MAARDRLLRLLRARPEPVHCAYSRWDGAQSGFDFDADHLFDELADDLLYHGDLSSALRRMMTEGFRDRTGREIKGLRDLLERLRQRRRDLLEHSDLGGVFGDIAEALRDVVRTERHKLADLDAEAERARSEGDERRADLSSQTAALKNAELDMLPGDLAGQVKALENYDFESEHARRQFEELAERLRQQILQQFLDRFEGIAGAADRGASDSAQTGDPQALELQRLKDMLSELNEMLAQRARGETVDFDGFMERHGDFFPENPTDLDELLAAMARRMAAAQSMLNSMTPDQRGQLQQLSDQLLSDMDLNWQVSELAERLRSEFSHLQWGQRYEFDGVEQIDFSDALPLMSDLGDIDRLENLLAAATSPGSLAEADLDAVRRLLGDDAAESLESLAELERMLQEEGLAERRGGRFELTPRAIRRIGQGALRDLFSKLSADQLGRHALHRPGTGHERDADTKLYAFGDPFNLHIARTVHNAVTRNGGGLPVRLCPEDFEVERTESQVRSATVLMLDLSLSMPMRGNFLPAKKVAIALHALISSQFPRDYLGLVSFSNIAREFAPERLPEVSWDYVYGTNMHHGFMLARRMLNRQSGNKQIIMITDGEPTAHITASGQEFFSYPPARETVELTLSEVARCTRDDIRINTFMLDASSYLTNFVERVSHMNGGRAFFTTNQNLGDYLLMDFVEHKRSLLRASR